MNLPASSDASTRARESGTILVILLILIALFTVITLSASHSLTRLRTEVLSLEKRQSVLHEAASAGPPTTVRPEGPTMRAAEPPKPDAAPR